MPKMNVDEEAKRLFEPIELVIDGEDYVVGKIEADILESLVDNVESPNGMRIGIARLLGVDEKKFKKTDFRVLGVAMQFINKCMTEQLEKFKAKNVQGESVNPIP